MKPLIEGEDLYFNEQGYMVLTANYLQQRGYCCGNGCKNCPYEYEAVGEPWRSRLLAQRKANGDTTEKDQKNQTG